MAKSLQVLVGNKPITLTDRDYMAAGGQGVVYCQGPIAYKIYHDPRNMIPISKIKELSVLRDDEILAPTDVIYSMQKKPIGFIMQCVGDTEFLCKIFTRVFRSDKRISPQDIAGLVTRMQKKLEFIHMNNILVVDYNEMNFLLSNDIKSVYHIDVDSYQTKHHLAPALMESVRDHKGTQGKFSELTDWFSWAVVSFQMYIGIHPYKGMHPDFKPSEWTKRMDAGISVFDSKVKLPNNCQNFSVIPKKHLEWYKEIFIKNDRSIPPYADDLTISAAIVKTIISKGSFTITEINSFASPIRMVFYDRGPDTFILTSDGVFSNGKQVTIFEAKNSLLLDTKNKLGLCSFNGNEPLIVSLQKNNRKVIFYDLNKTEIGSIAADNIMLFDGLVYSVIGRKLIQNSFDFYKGNIIHKTEEVATLSNSYKMFRGVIVQDNFMRCLLTFPYGYKLCTDVYVKELNARRIIDACFTGKVCVVFSESKGKYFISYINFNVDYTDYIYVEENVNSIHPVNVITLINGMSLSVDDEKIVLFKDNKRKEIYDPPIEADMRLYLKKGEHVLFVNDNKLYGIKMS